MKKSSVSRGKRAKSSRPSSRKPSVSTANPRHELIVRAREASVRAYAPYSRYHVGAALELSGGRFVTGCNVENASYGLTVCAERAAVFSLIGGGIPSSAVRRLGVSARGPSWPVPCGACRQVLSEFFGDLEIVLDRGTGKSRTVRLRTLLPEAFTLGKVRR